MFNKLKYPALNAKIKGMFANHLTEEELEELLRVNNFKEAIYFLKIKFPSLENINENMHRKEIEQELNNLFIIEIIKISKYLNKQELNVFMQFLSKYEINCVKNVFRNVTTNRLLKVDLKNIDNWTNKVFPDIDGINQISEETAFLKILKNKEYYKIFKEYEDNIENAPLEEIEVNLDKFYFEKIYNLTNNKLLKNIIGMEIDLLNIIWIYRVKKYFNYTESEVKKVLIPINYKLNKNIIQKLINSNNFDEMQTILNDTIYKKVFTNENTAEHDKDKFLYNKYIEILKTKLFNICTVFCHINLIDIEIKNIINIIEGIRYNLDKSEIQKRIII